jgi:hypothetical protein
MAKLSFQEIVQKVDHRWCSPLNQKEDLTRPVIEGWVGGNLFILSQSCPGLISILAAYRPESSAFVPGSRSGPDEF